MNNLPKLIFATNNPNKVNEIQSAIGHQIEVISLAQANILIEIPEPHDSIQANASEKSVSIHKLTGQNCFSEDSGLEVDSLGGEPGVKSARYAGEGKTVENNIDKLLQKLGDSENRKARFRTVISLIWDKKEYLFEGICEGGISYGRKGTGGFGYDPVFVPEGSDQSFAQMSMEEKNKFSHRRKAADQLVQFLNQGSTTR